MLEPGLDLPIHLNGVSLGVVSDIEWLGNLITVVNDVCFGLLEGLGYEVSWLQLRNGNDCVVLSHIGRNQRSHFRLVTHTVLNLFDTAHEASAVSFILSVFFTKSELNSEPVESS